MLMTNQQLARDPRELSNGAHQLSWARWALVKVQAAVGATMSSRGRLESRHSSPEQLVKAA